MKVYVYANLLSKIISNTNCNFWTSEEERSTGLYKSDSVAFQLLEVIDLDISKYDNYNYTPGAINALERELDSLAVKAENIRVQIQELKCIGHESIPIFDDDIPY